METILLVVIVLVVAILSIFLTYYLARLKFEERFRQWREIEVQKWEEETVKATREAVIQSRAVLGGKFVEQLAPYLPEFKYDPTEARFIGSPIDLIVFP